MLFFFPLFNSGSTPDLLQVALKSSLERTTGSRDGKGRGGSSGRLGVLVLSKETRMPHPMKWGAS